MALRTVPAVHASIVVGLIPIVTSLAAVVRHGERPRPLFWVASALGVLAVVVLRCRGRSGPAAARRSVAPVRDDLGRDRLRRRGKAGARHGRLARDLLGAPAGRARPRHPRRPRRRAPEPARLGAGVERVRVRERHQHVPGVLRLVQEPRAGRHRGGRSDAALPAAPERALGGASARRIDIAPRAWVAALLVVGSVALSRWSQVHPRSP